MSFYFSDFANQNYTLSFLIEKRVKRGIEMESGMESGMEPSDGTREESGMEHGKKAGWNPAMEHGKKVVVQKTLFFAFFTTFSGYGFALLFCLDMLVSIITLKSRLWKSG